MTTDQDKPTADQAHDDPREQCAGCAAVLVADQRYCLQCGARRGKPRLDFTAFWKPLSLTDSQHEQSQHGQSQHGQSQAPGSNSGSGWSSRLGTGLPSRQLTGVLAAGVLGVGILAGIALGPGPASSPADSATLAQRALAALATQASSSPANPPVNTGTTPGESDASTTPAEPNASTHQTTPATKASSSEAPSSTESSSSESSTGASEGSSSEGSSKGSGESEKTSPGTPVKLPPIKHVWLIALSGQSFANVLAQSKTDPYLAKQLVPKGTLLSTYTLSASSELANGIALLSGQGVNVDTEQNCPTYTELQPPTINATTGLTEGVGCVYPHEVQTLADELTAAGLTWKAYVQGMQKGAPGSTDDSSSAPATSTTTSTPADTSTTPSSTSGTNSATGTPTAASPATGATPTQTAGEVSCRHPELGAADPNQIPAPGDPYLTFRNPFVYFHSLLDSGACASNDVDLGQLQGNLSTPADTPNLSWIVPSACNDGSSTPCAAGAPAGLAPADAFLKEVVPRILATSAYGKEGLIVIVPDSPPSSSANAATKPVGALLISPFVRSDARVAESFNDFSLAKSLARLFGVLPLGHANDPSTASFGATVYGTSGKAAAVASTAKKAAQAASAAQPRDSTISHAGG
jgi:hypothetical protein